MKNLDAKLIICFGLLVCIFVWSSCSRAGEWTRDDTYRQALYLALHTYDWAQTREIVRNPAYIEVNPILGEYPTSREVDRYFLGTAILHTVIAYYLPSDHREKFQYVTIGMQVGAVMHNRANGIRVTIKF